MFSIPALRWGLGYRMHPAFLLSSLGFYRRGIGHRWILQPQPFLHRFEVSPDHPGNTRIADAHSNLLYEKPPCLCLRKTTGRFLLKFDYCLIACIPDTTSPGTDGCPSRAETETVPGRTSRELHPSEDLSELPRSGQEYQRWCCHRKTDRPRSAFRTVGPAPHLICRFHAE